MNPKRPVSIMVIALGLLLTFSLPAAAQNPSKPKPVQPPAEAMDSSDLSDMMTPMMDRMMRVMMNAVLEIAALPETAEQMATFSKNYFDALMRKGFSRTEALQIVMAVGMPSMPGQR